MQHVFSHWLRGEIAEQRQLLHLVEERLFLVLRFVGDALEQRVLLGRREPGKIPLVRHPAFGLHLRQPGEEELLLVRIHVGAHHEIDESRHADIQRPRRIGARNDPFRQRARRRELFRVEIFRLRLRRAWSGLGAHQARKDRGRNRHAEDQRRALDRLAPRQGKRIDGLGRGSGSGNHVRVLSG